MAIRNIAHSIRAGEISLGVAVGVESMSLKSVPFVRDLRRCASGRSLSFSQILILFLSVHAHSPRPTPLVVDSVGANPSAHDCIQVRSMGLPSTMTLVR
jgi:acetyl-CoA acyltransferase 1